MKPTFRITVLAILVLISLTTTSLAGDRPTTQTLPNGLKVVVQENHTAPVISLRIYVRTGSVYEGKYGGSGISHYFEHLISGGTTSNHSEDEITKMIERMGNANNAYTTRGHTAYYITTTPAHMEEAVNLLADWMQNCTFPEDEFKRERGVILEEIRKGREEPGRILQKAVYETMFRNHPARYPVIGYEELFKKIKRQDILNYYDQRYAPNNMVVSLAGDFEAKSAMKLIEEAFSGFQRRTVDLPTLPDEPRQMGKRRRHITRENLGKTHFHLAFHTVPLDNPDLYPLDVMSYILSHGRSSRLVKRLQEELRLVFSISSYSYTPSYGAGMLGIRGTCQPGKLNEAIEEILNVVYDLREKPVSDSELAKARRQKVANNAFSRQTAEGVASELGLNVLTTGNAAFTDTYLEGIKSVKAAQIKQVARRYLKNTNLTVVTLGPKNRDTSQKKTTDQKAAPGNIQKTVLDNGLRVLIKRTPANPLVHIQWLSLGGARLDPKGKEGLSRITARLLTRGTEDLSGAQIASEFDAMGGRLSPISGNNSMGIKANVMAENFGEAFKLLSEMVRRPTFPKKQIKTVKKRTLLAIKGRRDNWQSELSYLFKKRFFQKSPYRFGPLGTKQSVKSITRTDIRDFYKHHVLPPQSVLTVFGNVETSKALQAVKKRFGDMKPGKPAEPEIKTEAEREKAQTVEVEVNRQISALMVGYPGMKLTNTEDRFAMEVLDAILSGIGYPGGWLQKELRGGERDLVYVVHAFNFMGLEPGYFGVMAATSPSKTDRVLKIIRKNVDLLKNGLVSSEELASAKNMCVTMNKLQNQTNASMAMKRGLSELYGLGYRFPETYEKRINEVTVEDVQRVARKYLKNPLILRLNGRRPGSSGQGN